MVRVPSKILQNKLRIKLYIKIFSKINTYIKLSLRVCIYESFRPKFSINLFIN